MPAIDPGHATKRSALLFFGAVFTGVGAICMLIGVISIFSAMSSASRGFSSPFHSFDTENHIQVTGPVPPRDFGLSAAAAPSSSSDFPHEFWLCLVGVPLMGVGMTMLRFGLMGNVARYVAGELAPVGAATLNYVAQEGRPGITELSQSIAAGMQGVNAPSPDAPAAPRPCPRCGQAVEADQNFCSHCGAPAPRAAICRGCGAHNTAGAKFCGQCGQML